MWYSLLELTDQKHRTFHVEVRTPSFASKETKVANGTAPLYVGEWRALEMGYLRLASGAALRQRVMRPDHRPHYHNRHQHTRTWPPQQYYSAEVDLHLGIETGQGGFRSGIVLRNFDTSGDMGAGDIEQSWVLQVEPGSIRWRRVSTNDVVRNHIFELTWGNPRRWY